MMTNLRGEMTIDAEQQLRLKEGKFVRTVAATLKVGSEKVRNGLVLVMVLSYLYMLVLDQGEGYFGSLF